jgi:hypothetical protein
MISIPTVIKGTLTGVRISAVDLTAFIDNCAAVIPYCDGRSIIRLKDSGGRYASAVLCAVGTGETLSGELVDSWTNSVSNPYETFTAGAGNLITQAVNTTGGGFCYKSFSSNSGILYKNTNAISVSSGGNPAIKIADSGAMSIKAFTLNDTSYVTASGGAGGYQNMIEMVSGVTDFSVTGYTTKQVLTPSTLGCTLLNAIGGAQSFISKDAAFTYNADSYTYEIFTTLRIANPRSIMGVNTFRN